MNSTTPYEKLLAAKLDQVPVPNMEDSIWASIAAQLDAVADAPDTDPESTPQSPSEAAPESTPESMPASQPKPNPWNWYGLGAIIAIAIAVWFFYSHSNISSQPIKPTDSTQQINPPVIPPPPDSIQEMDTMQIIPVKPQQKPSRIPIPDTIVVKDSIIPPPAFESGPLRVMPIFIPDSVPTKPAQQHVPENPPVQTKPAPPKPRGVKGISDDDYKISVIKDSTKGKQ
ncbi:hypothetical protein ACE38W_21165 [Chitinophaga sp. Hz27]|uniref:hypothetical protein n=1 Tax=Chitinophaga sp. Hz27 TaxID=3347169 RepID=UPI0035D63014